MTLPTHFFRHVATLAVAVAIGSCGGGSEPSQFTSDAPFAHGSNPPDGGGGDAGGGGGPPTSSVEEADIVQVSGDRLFAVSKFSGLSVLDLSTPGKLAILGHYRAHARPFEMYLRGTTAFVLFNGWRRFECGEEDEVCAWTSTSHVEALDVADPAHIVSLGTIDLPGDVADSRLIGDVLYTVTYQNGACYGCAPDSNTTVTSLSVDDPAHIAAVDQIVYPGADPYSSWWKRSVAVGEGRMYVAGVEWNGASSGSTNIKVVDISDPSGHMLESASIAAKGMIESRWQMDEKDGVLRVVSQPGEWGAEEVATVQTFQMSASGAATPLGELALALPAKERVRAARFDGDRAYVISAEKTDPLFTVDLTDPAHPALGGELAMPGFIAFIEPRGDRLYGVGYDASNPDGPVAVSQIDVTDLKSPTLLQRVNFGSGWARVPEDADRLHKAFAVDDQNGAIFVPHSSWYINNMLGCQPFDSGVQIIDFTHDTLTLRGSANVRSDVRRAFVRDGRLFSVSSTDVSIYDITNRDAPVRQASAPLAVYVARAARAGDHVVRWVLDWAGGAPRLEVVPASDPSRIEPLGSLSFNKLEPDGGSCHGWSGGLWVNGNMVYIARMFGEFSPYRARIAAIDISDPTAPVVRGQTDFQHTFHWGERNAVIQGGSRMLQMGSTLAFWAHGRKEPEVGVADDPDAWVASVHVVDFADPDNPTHVRLALPDALGHTALIQNGHEVLTSRWEKSPDDPSKVRFWLDRIDVSDPASPSRTSTLLPGTLLAHDAPSRRAAAVTYTRVELADVTSTECGEAFGWAAKFTANSHGFQAPGTCVGLHRTINLVDLSGDAPSILGQLGVDDHLGEVEDVIVGDDRAFGRSRAAKQLVVFGGLRAGALRVVPVDAGESAWVAAVSGQKALIEGYPELSLSLLDTRDLDNLSAVSKAGLDAATFAAAFDGDRVLCPLGEYGLQIVDLGQP